jgi:hypothetical protein
MSEFMDRPRVAPAETNGKTSGAGPRGLEDSPSGLAQDEGSVAPSTTEPSTPTPSPEASPRASGVSPQCSEPDIRDRLGRFDVGTPGGTGNPFGRHIARNRQLMLAYFTDEKKLALFGKLESMALGGNVAAHNTLLKYLVGKPEAAVNPDRVNHEEWEMRREQPYAEEVAARMQGQLPHQPVLTTQRIFDVAKAATYVGHINRGADAVKVRAEKQAAREERRARRKEERQRRRQG